MTTSVVKTLGPKAIRDAAGGKDASPLAREQAASRESMGGNPLAADRTGKIAAILADFEARVESDLFHEEIPDSLHEPGAVRKPDGVEPENCLT